MSLITVDTKTRHLHFRDQSIRCAMGRSGACSAEQKTEGDGFTPRGLWTLRTILYHRDRVVQRPHTKLPWRWINAQDGWSDTPRDPCYNRPVRLPHKFGAESLNRDDPLYDIIIILGHNDEPVIPGKGSAIFFHIWNEARPTEGCIAIDRPAMEGLIPRLDRGVKMHVI
ncbi:MAG: L,D-transpeptidase family protein [Parasphingorhabdus sp.]|uniref:L,D-transpeptidase family protein n=1 Tax=Parasphingorhabdus sp. TaxID=2709688 RepID=UPI00329809E4